MSNQYLPLSLILVIMFSKTYSSLASIIGIVICLMCANLMAGDGLANVKALVYSSTAAELLWDRENAEIVQVSYNGQVVATLDADSYFTDQLSPSVFHRFEIRTRLGDNVFSARRESDCVLHNRCRSILEPTKQ